MEHVFGSQANMGGTLVRSIGVMRKRARIGLKNLAYNMRRFTPRSSGERASNWSRSSDQVAMASFPDDQADWIVP